MTRPAVDLASYIAGAVDALGAVVLTLPQGEAIEVSRQDGALLRRFDLRPAARLPAAGEVAT
jgi:hypothetical protein